jgi:plastocyanin
VPAVVLAVLATWVVAATAGAVDQTITFPTSAPAGPYTPSSVTIAAGERVTFNGAFANHPLVWDDGTFPTQSSGTSSTFTFTQAGTFPFHCQIHPTAMVGSVQVGSAGPDAFATPDFTWAPASPQVGEAATFTPTGFADPDGSIARYEWDLDGDGSFETTGASPSRSYAAAGTVTVRLRYVDDRGQTSPATAHSLPVRGAAGGGSGAAPGQPGGTGGSGAPNQPGAPANPTAPSGQDQGAGSGDARPTAPRLRIAARALAFRAGRARATLTAARASTLTATLRRAGVVLATGRATARRAGAVTVTLKLTRAGVRVLRPAHAAVRATLTVVARPRAGRRAPVATVKRTLLVRRR